MRLGVRARQAALAALVGVVSAGCDEPASSTGARLVDHLGLTHIHPGWRDFAAIPLRPLPPDRYDILLDDVPGATRVSFRINDQNSCDQNPTGAVTRNIFANDVPLVQNATTPGDEPGYAFMVAPNGTVTQ